VCIPTPKLMVLIRYFSSVTIFRYRYQVLGCLRYVYPVCTGIKYEKIHIGPDTTKIRGNLLSHMDGEPTGPCSSVEGSTSQWLPIFYCIFGDKVRKARKHSKNSIWYWYHDMIEMKNVVWVRLTESKKTYHGTSVKFKNIYIFLWNMP
jgi:hypothetical protein